MTSWWSRANCRGMDPNLFYPSGRGNQHEDIAQAKAICAECVVRADCLAEALATPYDHDHGIWAGLTRAERNKLRRQVA